MHEVLGVPRGLSAIIGSGGKSTLLRALAEELSGQGRVIVATSTKMRVPDWCPVYLEGSVEDIKVALESESCICVGTVQASTSKLDAPCVPFEELVGMADYVLVEADGSRGLPLKAHAAHEPVIPACASRVICVVGIDGVGQPVSCVAHRPELYASLSGLAPDDAVTPEALARVLQAEHLHDTALINKVHTASEWQAAERIACLLEVPVVAGSLQEGSLRCLR